MLANKYVLLSIVAYLDICAFVFHALFDRYKVLEVRTVRTKYDYSEQSTTSNVNFTIVTTLKILATGRLQLNPKANPLASKGTAQFNREQFR